MTTRERIQKIEARLDALEGRRPDTSTQRALDRVTERLNGVAEVGTAPATPRANDRYTERFNDPAKEPLPSMVPDNFLTEEQRAELDVMLYRIRCRKPVGAIKSYRALTGLGLKASKEAVMGCK